MKLARKGSLIFSDNMVRNGGIVDAASKDPDIQGRVASTSCCTLTAACV